MRIICPECNAGFNVPEIAIKEAGRKLRCGKCRHEWHQMPLTKQAELKMEAAPSADDSIKENADILGHDQNSKTELAYSDLSKSEEMSTAEQLDQNPENPIPIPSIENIRTQISRPKSKGPILLYVLLSLTLILPTAIIISRSTVIDFFPETSLLFDSIGLHVPVSGESLTIKNLGVWRKIDGNMEFMLIKGELFNDSQFIQPIPIIISNIEDASGRILDTTPFLTDENTLLPGDVLPFEYQIPQPNPKAERVTVTFSDQSRNSSFGY